MSSRFHILALAHFSLRNLFFLNLAMATSKKWKRVRDSGIFMIVVNMSGSFTQTYVTYITIWLVLTLLKYIYSITQFWYLFVYIYISVPDHHDHEFFWLLQVRLDGLVSYLFVSMFNTDLTRNEIPTRIDIIWKQTYAYILE